MLPTLLGKSQPPKAYIYFEFCTKHQWGHAVRVGEWKAVSFAVGQPMQLYHLPTDISESNDLAAKHPDIVQKLSEIAQRAHTNDPEWPVDNCITSMMEDTGELN